MNRKQFQGLADLRLVEAKTFFDARQYSGAYYIAGYAIECGLKACIAKMTRRYDFPDRKRAQESYQHNPEALAKAAGLWDEPQRQMKADRTLAEYWAVVKDWSEESRYETHPQLKARDLYQAVSDPDHGVLAWIKHRW